MRLVRGYHFALVNLTILVSGLAFAGSILLMVRNPNSLLLLGACALFLVSGRLLFHSVQSNLLLQELSDKGILTLYRTKKKSGKLKPFGRSFYLVVSATNSSFRKAIRTTVWEDDTSELTRRSRREELQARGYQVVASQEKGWTLIPLRTDAQLEGKSKEV